MVADTFIQLPSDGAGKKVDTRTESTNSEHREVHTIGDPATNEGVAVVTNIDPVGEIYGIVVRDPNSTTIASNTTKVVNQGDAATALRVVIAGNSDASVTATQTGTWTVALSGSLSSTVATGDTLARVADAGAAPVKVGGIARQTNPTAYADGDRANFTSDDLGRQLVRPVQIRDLILTAYATVTNITETTLLTAAAATYADLISVVFANSSTAAVRVQLRAVVGGNVVQEFYCPATSSVGWVPPVPWPQDATGNAWTFKNAASDDSTTTIACTALFSKEA